MKTSYGTGDSSPVLSRENYEDNFPQVTYSNRTKDTHWAKQLSIACLGLMGSAGLFSLSKQVSATYWSGETPQPQSLKQHASFSETDQSQDEGTLYPHIVFILADDMGFNDIGYGSSDLVSSTPTLDALAATGIKLTKYYTQQSCTPARTALLSGRYPFKAGFGYDSVGSFEAASPYGLDLEYNLLPRILHNVGYRTAIIGKWNIGHFEEEYLPHRRGFEFSLTYQSDEIMYYNYSIRPKLFSQSHMPEPKDMLLGVSGEPFHIPSDMEGYTANVFTDRAITEISASKGGSGDPLFLYLAYQSVHVPHETPPSELYSESDEWKLENATSLIRKKFAKTLIAFDRSVKRIWDTLIDNKIYESTYILFASDNGGCPSDGSSNYPLRGGKFDYYEGGVRVPAFVHSYQLMDRAGSTISSLFHVTDWLPTIMKIANVSDDQYELVSGIDGVNQLAVIKGNSIYARDQIVLGLNRWHLPSGQQKLTKLEYEESKASIISGSYKLIKNSSSQISYPPSSVEADDCLCGYHSSSVDSWLFDLANDPYEERNLASDLPDVMKAMDLLLRQQFDLEDGKASSYVSAENVIAGEFWGTAGFVIPWRKAGADSRLTTAGG